MHTHAKFSHTYFYLSALACDFLHIFLVSIYLSGTVIYNFLYLTDITRFKFLRTTCPLEKSEYTLKSDMRRWMENAFILKKISRTKIYVIISNLTFFVI